MSGTLPPTRLNDTADAANLGDLIADNFRILAEAIGTLTPTYQGASPTTVKGPPTVGAHILLEYWRDSLGAEFVCTAAGTPGTWRQIQPAYVTANPVGVPNGYWINRTDLSFGEFVWNNGTTTWDESGTAGPPGTDGSLWYNSSGAPAGGTGVVGDWALDTAAGAGLGDVYEKTGVATWTLRGNIRGASGAAGAAGSVWRDGAGAPAGGLGLVGDFYLNTSNGDYYEKTGASTWTLRGNLTGPAGTAGSLPSGHVEITSPVGTTSATLVDVPGMSLSITLDTPAHVMAVASFEVQTQSGATASTIEVALNINGVDHQASQRYLSGTSDVGIGCITHRTDTPLSAGTYTVKLRYRRVSGTSTPGIDNASLCAIGMQGAALSVAASNLTIDSTTYNAVPALRTAEMVLSNRTYYVNPSTGSDSNSGLTSGTAFLTIQKACDVAAALIVPNGVTLTIQLAAGTYTAGAVFPTHAIPGGITILGDAGTPGNVIISISSGANVFYANNVGRWTLNGMKLTSSNNANCIRASYHGQVFWLNIEFGATGTGKHVYATRNGLALAAGNYSISGAAGHHWYAEDQGQIDASATVTITGTPAFGSQFANAISLAVINVPSCTFSGSATGTRYSATENGVIRVGGGGANYLPGNGAGSTATGGQYN